MLSLRCTAGCEQRLSVESRQDAIATGWSFVEIATKARVKYWVICPGCKPKWLVQALEDKRGKE